MTQKKKKLTHGGPRPGSGRKPGRRVKTRSLSMLPDLWEKIDRLREKKTRSAWIAELIKKI
jgi:hypothetical protein